MTVALVLIGLVAIALVWGLTEGLSLWNARVAAARAVDRARSRSRGGEAAVRPQPLDPESRFVVRISEDEVVCERPDGKVERVRWDDLQKVEIVTTDEGPFLPDVFWVLHGTDTGCVIPQGATGEGPFLDRMHALPGFDNGAMIQAMTSVENKRFLCWRRAL